MPDQEVSYYWLNVATGQIERVADTPLTDEQARQFIPQDRASQSLYRLRRLQGDSAEEAMECVLLAVISKEERETGER